MEKTFWDAAHDGEVEEVKDILMKNPSLNVNWKNEEENAWTALHAACWGHALVVSILLAHPDIDPNLKSKYGDTPFMWACLVGNTSSVRLLLKDSKIMVNNIYGETSLGRAAYNGYLDIIKWWIASGREMDLGKPGDISHTDAIGAAKKRPCRSGHPAGEIQE